VSNIEASIDPQLRAATLEDVPLLARHRRMMFESFLVLTEEDALALERAAEKHMRRTIPTGGYIGRVVEVEGSVVSSGGMVLRELLPRPNHLDGAPEAVIVGMWTEIQYRCRGLARLILQSLLDCCREMGIRRIVLHASSEGRTLYESHGFEATNEMRLKLPGE
jgi:ribosomal protein S18 acetylase RimI-like enzyme